MPPGTVSVTASLLGFRTVTQSVELGGSGKRQLDFTLQAALSAEVVVTALKRDETVLNVPFSIAAPTEQVLRARGVEDIEGVAANVGGFTVQNLGPGQSQVAMRGVSAGQIVRDQPGVKEQVGDLPRRVGDLALALHARHRPVRHQSRGSAARPARHAVRLRLVIGHGPLHHQPAASSASRTASPSSGRAPSAAEAQVATRRWASMSRSATGPRCAWRRTTPASPATSTRSGRTSRWMKTSTAASGRVCGPRSRSSPTSACRSRRDSCISRSERTGGTASTPSTSSRIRSRRRGRPSRWASGNSSLSWRRSSQTTSSSAM